MDQYDTWRHALAGHRLDFGQKGQPPSGFYRHITRRGIEAVAIWRLADGTIKCKRSIFGNGVKMDADQIDELLASCGHYPISYELWEDVTKHGKPWPPEYGTRLTVQEIKDGVPWTPELGRAKLGIDVENPGAVAGHNNPPEEITADQELGQRIMAAESSIVAWLEEIGGAPRDNAEADKLANYAAKFADFKTSAESQHKAEKEPHLIAGRMVDAKWFPWRDKAAALRKRVLQIAQQWLDAETERRQEEARKANEEARRLAAEQAGPGAPAPPIEEVKAEPVKIGNLRTVSTRTRTIWRVTDPATYAAYLCRMKTVPPDLLEVLGKIANRQGAAGVNPPGVTKSVERSAV